VKARIAFFAFLVILFGETQACRVLDPELQGSYAGPCVDGLAQGLGEAKGTAEYRGELVAGRKHGKGVKTWPNGDRYEGDWVADRKDGTGVYVFGKGRWEGERYEGAFSNDRRHGYGVYRWPSGDRYEGGWDNDAMAGAATPMMAARAKHEQEIRAAVGREGQAVCRETETGGARRWVRGVVVAVEKDRVGVRMDASGAVVWDVHGAWTPCW